MIQSIDFLQKRKFIMALILDIYKILPHIQLNDVRFYSTK